MDTTLGTALTDEQIAQLAALLNAPNVTAGPWVADGFEIHQAHPTDELLFGEWVAEACDVDADDTGAANAALIVAAVNALPRLLDEVQTLRARLAEIAELHEPMGGDCGYCADETESAHRWPCPTAKLAAQTA